MAKEKRRSARYTDDLPRAMYTYFAGYSDTGIPSFAKFARTRGITLEELETFRSRRVFAMAYKECLQIRKDLLIDGGLSKKLDPSTVKFLLSSEYGMDKDAPEASENEIRFTLEVVE